MSNNMQDIIDEIKSRCDIVETISNYISVKSSGTNYKALCPFHSEKTPSFYISPQKQIYNCFGCGEGGDVIKFIMKMENIEFIDAVKILAEKCGLEISSNMDEETKKNIQKLKHLTDIHVEAARYYLAILLQTKNNGYRYFKNRGLDDKTIKNFGLGYAPKDWQGLFNYLTKKGFDTKDLLESGLISEKKDGNGYRDRFINRVIFPIFDYRGSVIGFGGRVLDDSLPKYLNSPDTPIFNKRNNLYGLNFAKKNILNKTLILVEGYMDLISLAQYGVKNVVATLGTALTEDQGKLIKKYADTVIISYDSDNAGINASLRAIDILIKLDINVKVLNLGNSKDPDDFIRSHGLSEFNKILNSSIHYIQFKINIIRKNYNLNIGEDKIKFAKEAVNLLKNLKSPVEIDYYLKSLSSETDIDIDSLKREIYGKAYREPIKNKGSWHNKSIDKKIEKPQVIEKGLETIEKKFIKLLLENKEIRNKALLKLDKEDFILKDSKEIINYMIKNEDLDKISIDKLKSLNISENYISEIIKSTIDNITYENSKSIEELIRTIKRNSIQHKIDELLNEQRNIEHLSKGENIDAKEVDEKVMKIALEIIQLRKILHQI